MPIMVVDISGSCSFRGADSAEISRFSFMKVGTSMRRINALRVVVFFLVAVFILASGNDLNAQGKKEKGEKRTGKEKKTEEKVRGEREERGDSLTADSKKGHYEPKKLKKEEKMDWEGGTPPGWSRGGKTGWDGTGAPPGKMKKADKHGEEIKRQYPPGSEDWDGKKKEEWDRDLEKTKERVRKKVRQREGTTEEDEESAVRSVEGAAREGVPVERAEKTVEKAIERGMKGEEIEKVTRAMSYGADKNVDYEKLDSFVSKKIDSGESGDELAVSIYREVDSGSMEKVEKEKKPWWKRIFKRN